MTTGRITFGPPLTRNDARTVVRHLGDTTRGAVCGVTDARADARDQRIAGLLDERRLLLEEIGLLQRVLGLFADHDCDCHDCAACAAREAWQGSLRRYPK